MATFFGVFDTVNGIYIEYVSTYVTMIVYKIDISFINGRKLTKSWTTVGTRKQYLYYITRRRA